MAQQSTDADLEGARHHRIQAQLMEAEANSSPFATVPSSRIEHLLSYRAAHMYGLRSLQPTTTNASVSGDHAR